MKPDIWYLSLCSEIEAKIKSGNRAILSVQVFKRLTLGASSPEAEACLKRFGVPIRRNQWEELCRARDWMARAAVPVDSGSRTVLHNMVEWHNAACVLVMRTSQQRGTLGGYSYLDSLALEPDSTDELFPGDSQ